MYAEGYKNITNIDFSEIVVEDMQLKYKNAGYDSTLKCTNFDTKMCTETSDPWKSSKTKASIA